MVGSGPLRADGALLYQIYLLPIGIYALKLTAPRRPRYGDDKLGPLHAPDDWRHLERVGRPTHIRGEYTDVAPWRLPPGCLLWDAWPVS